MERIGGSTILALVKETTNERYFVMFSDTHRQDALRMLGKWAADPELSFSWYDAAVLAQRIRAAAQEQSGLNVRIAE